MTIFAFLLELAYLAYQISQRRKLPATSSYIKTSDGDWTSFDVTPARPTIQELHVILPIAGFSTVIMLVAALTVMGEPAYENSSHYFYYFGTWFPFFFVIVAIWSSFRDTRPKPHRGPARFRVSPTTIEKDGQQYSTQDIHELRVMNAVDGNLSFAVYDDRSAINAGGHIADAKRAAKIAYSLNLEEGGRSHTLAGGMTEPTVNGLLHDVMKALGREIAR